MLRRGFQPLGLVHSHFIKNSFTKASGNKSLSSVVKQFNQKRSYSTNNKNNSSHEEHGKQQKVEDEYDGIGDELPEPPLRDVILARIAGASAMFWFLYKMREEGLIIFGLERPHWEHAFDDSDSDRDDEYWDNAFQDDEETLDLTVEYHLSKPESDFDKKVGFMRFK
ncbi:hypothetical protein ABK040_016559 [Willaertia magna]